jgi:hypothetical protein
MADSPAMTLANKAAKPATGTGFVNVVSGLSSLFASFVPIITAVGGVKNGIVQTTGGISPYSTPQIVTVPGQTAAMDYTPFMIAGGVGLLGLLTVAMIARK